jgi:hypothetical protein
VDGRRLECALEAGILDVAVGNAALVELDEVRARRDAVFACPGEILDRASEVGGVCGPKAGRADRAVFGEGAQDLDQVGVRSRRSEPKRCYGSVRCPRRRCGEGPLSVVRRRKVFS